MYAGVSGNVKTDVDLGADWNTAILGAPAVMVRIFEVVLYLPNLPVFGVNRPIESSTRLFFPAVFPLVSVFDRTMRLAVSVGRYWITMVKLSATPNCIAAGFPKDRVCSDPLNAAAFFPPSPDVESVGLFASTVITASLPFPDLSAHTAMWLPVVVARVVLASSV